MPDGTEPHPLDDFEFGKADPIDDSRTRAHKPLLRISVIIAAAAFASVFVFSLIENGAQFNSPMQQLCNGIKNVSAVVMLMACCGVLFAYRLPHIDPVQLRNGALATRGWLSNRFALLIVINLMAILMMWLSVFFLAGLVGVYFAIPLGFVIVCLVGLVATMAVVHKGYLRGYAVGTLAVLLLIMNGGLGMFFMFIPGFRGGTGGVAGYSIAIATLLTIAPLVGLVCAGYVAVIEKFSRD